MQYAVGYEVTFWDKDGTNPADDDYLGFGVVTSASAGCWTFEWENAPHGEAEANPDVYLKVTNRVVNTVSSSVVEMVTGNGVKYADVSWRDYPFTPGNTGVAVDCQPGVQCQIMPGGVHVINPIQGTTQFKATLGLDSAQRTLYGFQGQMTAGVIKFEYPASSTNPCPDMCQSSRSLVEAFEPTAGGQPSSIIDGMSVSHEFGHIIQMMMFSRDTLVNDCSAAGAGHSFTSLEYGSCYYRRFRELYGRRDMVGPVVLDCRTGADVGIRH